MGSKGRRIMDNQDYYICIDCQSKHILDTVIVSVNENDKITDWTSGSVWCGDCQGESICHIKDAHLYPELDNITKLPLIEKSK